MICNRCGAKNSDGRKKCFHCGYVFPTTDQTALSGVFAVRDEDGGTQDFARDAIEADASDPVYDEKDESFDDQDGAVTEKRGDITHLALDHEKHETVYESARAHTGTGYTVAIWTLCVLFIVVLIVTGVLMFQYLNRKSENDLIAPPSTAQIALSAPQIERITDQDGTETVHAVFYGAPGDRLYLGCNDRYYTFVENTLTLDLHLNDLFDAGYTFLEPTVNATLNAYHIRDNKRYPYEPLSVLVHVPEADLTLLTVSESTIKVYRDKFTVRLWTKKGSQVYLNNTDITSFMDDTGIVSYDVDVSAFSTATYQLRVTQPYHTPRSATFILARDALPVSLTLATSNASLISDSTITITGSTEQDAVITCNLPLLSLEKNEIYNTYTAVADLSALSYGRQEVLITATNEKGSSTRSHSFWYWPDEKKITTTANRFDSAVATNANAYKRRNYVLNSVTVKNVVGPNTFEAVCTLDGIDYPLLLTIEYRTANIQVGSVFKVFASCEGASGNAAQMRVWYLYKQ